MPAFVNRKKLNVLHDKAKPHVSKKSFQKLRELGYKTMLHPAYSPNFAPRDFHFFKHLDNFLTLKIFRDDENIITAFEAFIKSRTQGFYVKSINKLVSR
uniref:Histone-lysine N-methyltransferase SETMAR n=1 Tax=Strongyloides venezuelensis TaxID=75913 RepID=A0A0K0F1K9_STRVS